MRACAIEAGYNAGDITYVNGDARKRLLSTLLLLLLFRGELPKGETPWKKQRTAVPRQVQMVS